jgi:sugar-specific transcriptional regulator TrmB
MSVPRWSLWAQIIGDECAARIYDSLLTHGALTPTQIAQHLTCPRSTLYAAFDILKEQGLISTSTKGRSVEYTAAAPSRWRALAEMKQLDASHVVKNVEEHLSEWTASFRQGSRPRARAFEGEEGLKAIREEVALDGGEVWEYFAVDARLRAQAKLHEHERIQKTSEVKGGRVLLALEHRDDAPPFFDRRSFEVRFIMLDQAPFAGSLTLVQNHAYLISTHDENFGLVVESTETVQLIRSLYVHVWNQAKPWSPPVGWGI